MLRDDEARRIAVNMAKAGAIGRQILIAPSITS
jgi:hypothetical protein